MSVLVVVEYITGAGGLFVQELTYALLRVKNKEINVNAKKRVFGFSFFIILQNLMIDKYDIELS